MLCQKALLHFENPESMATICSPETLLSSYQGFHSPAEPPSALEAWNCGITKTPSSIANTANPFTTLVGYAAFEGLEEAPKRQDPFCHFVSSFSSEKCLCTSMAEGKAFSFRHQKIRREPQTLHGKVTRLGHKVLTRPTFLLHQGAL